MKKKNKGKEEEPDFSSLFVFGYGCKIFRDDERARSIEENLIPWMGTDLTIDRFDGRGHLYNLTEYEARPGVVGEVSDDLERHEEELCEEERWRSLYQDDLEEQSRREEEDKRATSQGQFQFNYEETDSGIVFGPEAPREEDVEDDSEEYVPGPELDLPPDTLPPATMKEFSVIEKTAMLIAKQGPQMEILLKAKQADNPVFEFLWMEHKYNKFYRHLTTLVKTKQYRRGPPPPPETAPVSLVPQYSDMTASAPNLAPRITGMPFKRSQDCAYSQLINKIQKFAPGPSPASAPPAPPTEQLTGSKEASPAPPQPSDVVQIPEGPIVIPPPEVQTIIDKTASYVAKNGRSFEEIVLGKDESRFRFLSPGDRHYNYYLHKLNIYKTGNYDPSVSSEPLAFKMKKKSENPKENLVALNNPISGLDYASDSDDKSENEEKSETKVETSKSGFPNLKGFLPPSIVSNPKLYGEEEEARVEEEERKRLEENNKLRDKLAARAREKMVQVAKEKALQLERKKKAAHFLAQLAEKKTGVSSVRAVEGEADRSSAEEGELVVGEEEGAGPPDNNETGSVTAVSIWPPPAPPKLVIPRLASGPNSVVELSSDSEDEKPRKRRKRSRSRSRRREKRRKRSRSRSRHRRHKKDRRRHSSDRDRDSERRRRKRRHRHHTSSESEDERGRGRGRESHSDSEDSRGGRPEKSNPIIEEIVQPTVNKMTEELRAKVRAMLSSK